MERVKILNFAFIDTLRIETEAHSLINKFEQKKIRMKNEIAFDKQIKFDSRVNC